MASDNEPNIVEELNNLINAIKALLPSRNYLTQLVMLLPQDKFDAMKISQFIADDVYRNNVAELLDLNYNSPDVDLMERRFGVNGLGKTLSGFINNVFEIFNDSSKRKILADILGRPEEELINPLEEWFKIRIQSLLELEEGKHIRDVLKILLDKSKSSDRVNIREIQNPFVTRDELLYKVLKPLQIFKIIGIDGSVITLYDFKRYSHIIEKMLNEE